MFNKTKNKIKYQHKQTNSSVIATSFPDALSHSHHRPSIIYRRPSIIDHRPSVIATSFPILWLSHRIRYLLLQTTDLPNTIDLLHQTTDDGIASTIPTIASDISFRSASILPQTRNGAPFAVGLIQPSTAPFAMGWVGDQKRSPICRGSQPAQHSPICNGLGRLYIGRQYNRPSPSSPA